MNKLALFVHRWNHGARGKTNHNKAPSMPMPIMSTIVRLRHFGTVSCKTSYPFALPPFPMESRTAWRNNAMSPQPRTQLEDAARHRTPQRTTQSSRVFRMSGPSTLPSPAGFYFWARPFA